MLVVMLMLLLVGLGCAGPGASLTDEHAAIHEEACSSRQNKTEHDGRFSKACRPQRGWVEEIGNVLGGFAAAVRPPNP
jgi:hypothetical protein